MMICSRKTMFLLNSFCVLHDKNRKIYTSQDSLFSTHESTFLLMRPKYFFGEITLLFGWGFFFLQISRFISCSCAEEHFFFVFHFYVVRWITCVSRCFVIQLMLNWRAGRSHRDHQLCKFSAIFASWII